MSNTLLCVVVVVVVAAAVVLVVHFSGTAPPPLQRESAVTHKHVAEQYTGYLEYMLYGYHLDRAIPKNVRGHLFTGVPR